MTPKNLLYIITDEHTYKALGCYGNEVVQTPNLDRLAAGGTRFTNAYCPSPTCVPCRASLATGRWVHEIGTTSSAQPFEGQAMTWHERLRMAGHNITSIGKLHYRNTHPRNGFTEEIVPLHIVNGLGWVKGLIRDRIVPYDRETREFATEIGPGSSSYTDYDLRVTQEANQWIRNQAEAPGEKPWALFLSFVSPHYPLYAPQAFYDLYDPAKIELPASYDPALWPSHPYLKEVFYKFANYHEYFSEETAKIAIASYYALCTFLDHQIGEVLKLLEESGQLADTRIIYTSDHGDLIGDHGQWTKMTMYEGSVGIPFIMSGPDIPAGKVVETPVNLVDSYPTALDCMGIDQTSREQNELAGTSLFDIIRDEPEGRVTFSEYHDGMTTGFFMLRKGDWKLVYYAGYRPQLFNLKEDSDELNDLGDDPAYAEKVAELEEALRQIVDPEAANEEIKAEQARILASLGGENVLFSKPDTDFGYTPIRV
ncbi:MAG: sulfatase-like hydrolase/transferase [Chloroflexota bacterium]